MIGSHKSDSRSKASWVAIFKNIWFYCEYDRKSSVIPEHMNEMTQFGRVILVAVLIMDYTKGKPDQLIITIILMRAFDSLEVGY